MSCHRLSHSNAETSFSARLPFLEEVLSRTYQNLIVEKLCSSFYFRFNTRHVWLSMWSSCLQEGLPNSNYTSSSVRRTTSYLSVTLMMMFVLLNSLCLPEMELKAKKFSSLSLMFIALNRMVRCRKISFLLQYILLRSCRLAASHCCFTKLPAAFKDTACANHNDILLAS